MTLQIFPKHPDTDAYYVNGSYQPWAIVGRDKRFSDAELAAESYRAGAWLGAQGRAYATDEGRNIVFSAAFTFGPITRDEHEWQIVHRFCQLPHSDD